jgi:type VII secretion integral membrane protein EccD
MTDLVLPAAVPMSTYIDETVAVLADLLEDTPPDILAGFDFAAQGVWTFARPGSPPLKVDQSLDEAGVVDGSLLTLVSASRTERYRPLVEDVIDAIAVLDESPEFDRAALNRFIGVAIPILTLPVTAVAMRAWWLTGRSLFWPLAIGLVGIAVLVGSFVADFRVPVTRGVPADRCRRSDRGAAAARGDGLRGAATCRCRHGCSVVDSADAWRPSPAS